MAVLERGNQRVFLGSDSVIGRAPGVTLRLDDESVSWRHACVRWTGGVWELHDLGSRNGTFVNGKALVAGGRAYLKLGATVCFGRSPEKWSVASLDPPSTALVELVSGERVVAVDELLALPLDAPELFIARQADGEWMAELGGRAWEPQSSEVIAVGGRQYRFEAGEPVHGTVAEQGEQLTPANLRLEFHVSRDEEHVEVTIVQGERKHPLRQRAHGYLLLILARARLTDQKDPSLPIESHGWLYQDDLLRMLATFPTQLAVDVYRARKQFGEAGVSNATQIVERRASTQQLRLGVADVTIRTEQPLTSTPADTRTR